MPKKPQIDRIVQFHHEPPSAEPLSLSDADMYDQLYGTKSSSLFLGRFTLARIEELFDEYGIFDSLRKRSLWPVKIELLTPEQYQYHLRMLLEQGELAGELLIREGRFTPKKHYVGDIEVGSLEMFFIEWIMMQNPLERFTPERLPLPGQRHPPLGVGRKVQDLLERACRVAERDGLLNFPEFFHNAVLYMERYHFYDPKKEAEVMAVKRDLADLSLLELAWAVFSECVHHSDGGLYRWTPEGILWPNCAALTEYFESSGWREQVEHWYNSFKFVADVDKLRTRLEELADEVSRGRYTPAV